MAINPLSSSWEGSGGHESDAELGPHGLAPNLASGCFSLGSTKIIFKMGTKVSW